jgi:hypothetical protein
MLVTVWLKRPPLLALAHSIIVWDRAVALDATLIVKVERSIDVNTSFLFCLAKHAYLLVGQEACGGWLLNGTNVVPDGNAGNGFASGGIIPMITFTPSLFVNTRQLSSIFISHLFG